MWPQYVALMGNISNNLGSLILHEKRKWWPDLISIYQKGNLKQWLFKEGRVTDIIAINNGTSFKKSKFIYVYLSFEKWDHNSFQEWRLDIKLIHVHFRECTYAELWLWNLGNEPTHKTEADSGGIIFFRWVATFTIFSHKANTDGRIQMCVYMSNLNEKIQSQKKNQYVTAI
jgi:hypothetical protein